MADVEPCDVSVSQFGGAFNTSGSSSNGSGISGNGSLAGSASGTDLGPSEVNQVLAYCPWMIDVFKKSHQVIFYYYMVMLVTALVSNSVLLVLIFRLKITRRQTLTIYMSYIAVADILCIIVHYSQIVHSLQYFSGLRWQVSPFEGVLLCPINRMLSNFIPMLSSWIVVVMAGERWVSVRWPLKSSWICTVRNAVLALVVVTAATIVVTLPFAVSYELFIPKQGGMLIGEGGHIQCKYPTEAYWWHDRIAGVITNVYEVMGNVLPGFCLLMLSLMLLSTLKIAMSSEVSRDRRCTSVTRSAERAQKRLTTMITAIAASFTVLMLPNAIFRTYFYYWNPLEVNCDYVVKLLVRELLYALKNACCVATPLLYVFAGTDVKKAVQRNKTNKGKTRGATFATMVSRTANGQCQHLLAASNELRSACDL